MKKILVISWFYPPINSSEGLVTYKLLKNSRFCYDICMQDDNDAWSYGKEETLPECENVNRIAVSGESLEVWRKKVVEYFESHKNEYDIVMTRSMPPESHEIGLEIKKIKPEITWIASFGDPIANNPFELKNFRRMSPFSLKNPERRFNGIRDIISFKRIFRNLLWKHRIKGELAPFLKEQQLEKDILLSADYYIMNNLYQKKYMLKNYTENEWEKAVILPHSFDLSLYSEAQKQCSGDKIKMVYIGHLNDVRTPRLLLKAVRILKENYPDLSEKLEISFYGNMSAKDKVYIIDNELLDVIRVRKAVDYRTSLAIMRESDWLIHIDANLSDLLNENIFFAAKLADYIGADRPIFAITMFEGAGADVVRDVNGLTVSYTVDEIKNYLYLIAYKDYSVMINEKNRDKYNAVNVAANMDEFLADCVRNLAGGKMVAK